jgi:hypothetical protein
VESISGNWRSSIICSQALAEGADWWTALIKLVIQAMHE